MENYEVDRRNSKCDVITLFACRKVSTMKTPNSQIYINIPRKDSVTSSLNNFLVFNFDVINKTYSSSYANSDDGYLI